MAVTVEAAYRQCREIVARSSSSFAAGMHLFPRAARAGVYALYAFFRTTDDLADDDAPADVKRQRLAAWRAEVDRALGGGAVDPAGFLLAVADTAARYDLPRRLFDDCLTACEGDCGPVRLATNEDLEAYCDGVAGTVGEACLRILGYRDEATVGFSRHNARAVQITNILRDLEEDRQRDRVYVPADLLARFGADPEDVGRRRTPALRAALSELGRRAQSDYDRADALFHLLRPADRPPLVAMTLKYHGLLAALRADGFSGAPVTGLSTASLLLAAQLSRWQVTWRVS